MKNFSFTLKAAALFTLFLTTSSGFSQSIPVNFEKQQNIILEDFNGGIGTVVDNPFRNNDINKSFTVGKIVRDGGDHWAGSKFRITSFLDFSNLNVIQFKIYTSAPVGTTVRLKLEDQDYVEGLEMLQRDQLTTKSNEWETLTFEFPQTSTSFDHLVFMFDFWNIGDGSINSTFYFDDIKQTSLSEILLGIEKNNTNGLSVYPNPANSQWTIYSENTDITLVEVFDLQGKLMLSLNPNSPVAKINTSDLVKGMYFSKISTNLGTSTIRLVKK